MVEMFLKCLSCHTSFILVVLRIKKNKHKCDYHYVTMPMVASQILKFVGFTETQKSRYLENETLLSLKPKKKSLIARQGLIHGKI